MTREEAIIEAGIEYSIQNSPYCIGGDNFYEKARELNRNKSFEAGVIWADKNPKSPWISVKDDLPCNHEELLYQKEIIEGSETKDVFAINEYGEIWDDYMIYENGKWRWNDFEPAYWMIAPKLPKE